MMNSPICRRHAFTLIEVIVVIGIVAILAGILLVAVQQVQEASVRLKNMNNHRQIILGVHQLAALEENKVTKLTTLWMRKNGSAPSDMSIFKRLLPYVHGPQPKYDPNFTVEQSLDFFTPHVKVYRNPADPSWDHDPVLTAWRGKTSYAVNMMVFDGSIHFNASLPDGASNVVAFGDKYYARCSADKSVSQTVHDYSYLFDPQPDHVYGLRRATFADAAWHDVLPITDRSGVTRPSVLGKTFQVRPRPEDVDPHILQTCFRSGLTVSMCDGSVRTIGSGIHESVFWALVSPRSGEVIPE